MASTGTATCRKVRMHHPIPSKFLLITHLSKTSSGAVLSPRISTHSARPIYTAEEGFDFGQALLSAVKADYGSIDATDDINTPFSSPSPLSPVPDCLLNWLEDVPHASLEPPPPPMSITPPPIAARPSSQPLSDLERRKKRGHAKRAAQREAERHGGPSGYKVNPSATKRHIRPAVAIKTKLETVKLKVTKNGYTGGRDKGGRRRIYTPEELESEEGMRRVSWNGEYVYVPNLLQDPNVLMCLPAEKPCLLSMARTVSLRFVSAGQLELGGTRLALRPLLQWRKLEAIYLG